MKRTLALSLIISIILFFNTLVVTKAAPTNESVISSQKPIYAILKTEVLPTWQAIKTGIKKAAEDYNTEVTIESPQSPLPSGNDEQLNLFKDALAANPQAIILSPLDTTAFTPYLKEAEGKNIPVIGLDTNVASPIVKTLVGTDHYGLGELAAHKMAALIGKQGKVAVLDYTAPFKSISDRREGFINTIQENYPNVEVVRIPYPAEALTNLEDLSSLEEIIKSFITNNPDIKGIFAASSYESEALINAVKALNKTGLFTLIGSNSNKVMVDAIREGIMAGAVTTNPMDMGYKSVEAALQAAKGEKLPEFINVDYVWYDKTNMDNPEIQTILYDNFLPAT